jgi:hypothetical protein
VHQKPHGDVVQTFLILWLLVAAVIVATVIVRDPGQFDRFKAMSLLALGLGWPLLLLVFVLGVLLWLIGIAVHQFHKH